MAISTLSQRADHARSLRAPVLSARARACLRMVALIVRRFDSLIQYFAPVADPAPTKALLLCPDVWGWNGGRIRAVADAFAGEGYLVAVPKLLTPCMGEGTDGDALPPDGTFDMGWIKQFPWATQKPKVDAALNFLRSKVPDNDRMAACLLL
jgi:dienelactone hydrolase